jgi:hypothetical protein
MRFFTVCIALAALSTVTVAADKIKLPEDAKLLTKTDVLALYSGKSFNWSHPNTDKGTGTTVFDATAANMGGTYHVGKYKGEWEGVISWKGEQYCYKTRGKGEKKYSKVTCNLVYAKDGTSYEIDPKKKTLLSVNTPQK